MWLGAATLGARDIDKIENQYLQRAVWQRPKSSSSRRVRYWKGSAATNSRIGKSPPPVRSSSGHVRWRTRDCGEPPPTSNEVEGR